MHDLRHLGDDFTTDAITIVEQLEASARACSMNLGACLPEMLIWTILRGKKTVAVLVLESLGVDCPVIQRDLELFLCKKKMIQSIIAQPTVVAREWARREAILIGSDYHGTEHLLLGAVAAAEPGLLSLLADHGVTYKRLYRGILGLFTGNGLILDSSLRFD